MSHATLVGDGLILAILAGAVVLGIFILAVFRTPPEPDHATIDHAPGDAEPQDAHWPADGTVSTLAAQAAQAGSWDGGTEDPGSISYLPRHAVPGGPPWGPAPKPPGVLPGRHWPGVLPGGHRPAARSPEHAPRGRRAAA